MAATFSSNTESKYESLLIAFADSAPLDVCTANAAASLAFLDLDTTINGSVLNAITKSPSVVIRRAFSD